MIVIQKNPQQLCHAIISIIYLNHQGICFLNKMLIGTEAVRKQSEILPIMVYILIFINVDEKFILHLSYLCLISFILSEELWNLY